MAEEQTTLAPTLDDFDRARGDAADSVWAFGVGWDLLMRGVDVRQVRDGLREALALVRETQESPQELFGPADDHAHTLWDRWVPEGRLVLVKPNRSTFSEAVWLGLGLSTAYAVVLGVATLVRGDLTSTTVSTVLLIAVAIGMGGSLLHGLWRRRHSRLTPPVDAPAGLAWSLELTEILRTRYAMSGRRVRDIVAEANAHARETDNPIEVGFGTPTSYAARFAPDLRRRSRLTVAFFAALAVSVGVQMTDGVSWAEAGLLAGFGWLGWREHRTSRGLGGQLKVRS